MTLSDTLASLSIGPHRGPRTASPATLDGGHSLLSLWTADPSHIPLVTRSEKLSPDVNFEQVERATAEIFSGPGLYSLLAPNALPEPEVDLPLPPPFIHELEVEVPRPILPDVEPQAPVTSTEGWTPGFLAASSHEERVRYDSDMVEAAETLQAIQVGGETQKKRASQPAESLPPRTTAAKTAARGKARKAASTRAGSKRRREDAQDAAEPSLDAMVADSPATSTSVSVVSSRGSESPPAKKQKQSTTQFIIKRQEPPFDVPVSDLLKDQSALPGMPPREMFSFGVAWPMLTHPDVATGVFFGNRPMRLGDVTGDQGFEQLTHDEIILCVWMRILPTKYLGIRQRLFLEFHKACMFKPDGTPVNPLLWSKSKAQKVKGIDVNKISFLHAYYKKLGLWEHRWN